MGFLAVHGGVKAPPREGVTMIGETLETLGAAALCLGAVGLLLGVLALRRLLRRGAARRSFTGTAVLALLAVALLALGVAGLAVSAAFASYQAWDRETVVARVDAVAWPQGGGFSVNLTDWPDPGGPPRVRAFEVPGDTWEVRAVIVRMRPELAWLGADVSWQLDRIRGLWDFPPGQQVMEERLRSFNLAEEASWRARIRARDLFWDTLGVGVEQGEGSYDVTVTRKSLNLAPRR